MRKKKIQQRWQENTLPDKGLPAEGMLIKLPPYVKFWADSNTESSSCKDVIPDTREYRRTSFYCELLYGASLMSRF